MSLLKEVSKLLKKFKKKYFSANSLFYIDKLEKLKNQMGGGIHWLLEYFSVYIWKFLLEHKNRY